MMRIGRTDRIIRPSRGRLFTGLLLAIALSAVVACDRSPRVRQFMVEPPPGTSDWSRLFEERRIELQPLEAEPPLLRIGTVVIGGTGELIVPDGRAARILRFAHSGRFLGEIQGDSVKLGLIGAVALDRDGNIVIHDPSSNWVTVFSEPTFRVLRRFRVAAPIADMVVLNDGSLVAYHPENKAGAFARFSAAGRRLGAVHPIRDQKLRTFHGRVQNGGIARDVSDDLFGIEPSTFQLVRFSADLKVREILRGGLDTLWSPDARPFPPRLNPNDYRPAHEEWWDSFMHIGRPYAIRRGILLVSLFLSRGMSIAREFANVYRTDGRVLAQGLRVPHNGHIVGATGGKVYVVRNAHLVGDTAIAPLELYEYTLRGALAAEYADQRTTQSADRSSGHRIAVLSCSRAHHEQR